MGDGVRWKLENVEVPLGADEEALAAAAARALGVTREQVLSIAVLRRALDARKSGERRDVRRNARGRGAARGGRDPRGGRGGREGPSGGPRWSFHLVVTLQAGARPRTPPPGIRVVEFREEEALPARRRAVPPERPVVIIGAGPGGLFAAWRLAESGVKSVLLERGAPVRRRVIDVAKLWRDGTLDPESNPLFGEGGAGTFSDGKLYTRTRDPRIPMVLRTLVDFGAQSDILVDAHPHVGTNKLRAVIPRLREDLERRGVEVRFHTRVSGFRTERGRVSAVELADGTTIPTSHVILSVGHSARDTYRALHDAGVTLEPMAYALGVRIEHAQHFIDRLQLGEAAGDKRIGAASYRLARNFEDGRAAYSFCMCPGGVIVASMHEPGTVVTNGMSSSGRPGKKANAGLVVTVKPEDYAPNDGSKPTPFDAIAFQRRWEELAYDAGGGGFIAPAQRATDFLAGRPSEDLPPVSYLPGTRPADVAACLPPFVTRALKSALRAFDRSMPGFAGTDAVLVGVESRVSAPVRIPRGPDGESLGVRGLYPVGEGAGYAGGITSAAVDGMRAAEAVLATLEVAERPAV